VAETGEFHQALSDFAEVAQEFCDRLAGHAGGDRADIFVAMDELLPLLYYNGSSLAAVAPDDLFDLEIETGPEAETVQETGAQAPWDDEQEECSVLRAELAGRFGDGDTYLKLNDFGAGDGERDYEVEERLLSEDLSAIYHNLVHDLALYKAAPGRDERACARSWVQGFEGVWGANVPHMLARAFGELYEQGLPEEEEEELP
jgi:hypothetical protein